MFILRGPGHGADGVSESCRLIVDALRADCIVVSQFPIAIKDQPRRLALTQAFLSAQWSVRWGALGRLCGCVFDLWRLRRLIRQHRPEVIYAADQASQFFAIPAGLLCATPVVAGVRGASSRRPFWRYLLPLSSRIIPLSEDLARALPFHRSAFAKVRVIANPVPCVPRQAKAAPAGRLRLGYVGMFDERKNQLECIEALFPALNDYCELHFFGAEKQDGGDYLARCRAAAAARGGDAVHFHGIRKRDEIFSGIDALLLTSRSEGQPRALLEAVAYGVPFVSFPVESAREIASLSGLGIVTRDRSASELRKAILSLRHLCGAQPRPSAAFWARHSVEAVARQYEEEFARVRRS